MWLPLDDSFLCVCRMVLHMMPLHFWFCFCFPLCPFFLVVEQNNKFIIHLVHYHLKLCQSHNAFAWRHNKFSENESIHPWLNRNTITIALLYLFNTYFTRNKMLITVDVGLLSKMNHSQSSLRHHSHHIFFFINTQRHYYSTLFASSLKSDDGQGGHDKYNFERYRGKDHSSFVPT